MSICEEKFFNSKNIVLPIDYSESGKSIKNMIVDRLQEYCDFLSCCGFDEGVVKKAEKFKGKCNRIFEQYYTGKRSKAYKTFKCLMGVIEEEFQKLILDLDDRYFFRVRINKDNRDFKDKEMFHIPFDKRGQVRTERFSFPGLPCLYLGGSVYSCWVEMNRPNTYDMQVAVLKRTSECKCKVLDLSIVPQIYKKQHKENPQISLEQYAIIWMILAMCSIRVKNEKDTFHPEYIFPQMLMEYIIDKKSEILGIKYASVKVGTLSNKQYEEQKKLCLCYVFPTKSKCDVSKENCSKDKLHCFFDIKANISGRSQMLIRDAARKQLDSDYGDVSEDKKELYIYVGEDKIDYKDTRLYHIENYLKDIIRGRVEDGNSTS